MIIRTGNKRPKLGMGLVGLGVAGALLMPALNRSSLFELKAVARKKQDALEEYERELNAQIYDDIEQLCDSPDVDVVYIATPTRFHKDHVLTAVNRKKHVIVEKPMAVTLQDADEMIRAAEKNGVVLMVGHSHSYEPAIRKMRELVAKGDLGRPRMIHNMYYNDWIYRPRLREELDTALGGGVTFRQGAHQVDIIRYIAGGQVRSVRATTGIWDPERPAEGSHTIFMDFQNDAVATAVYNGYDHFHSLELTNWINESGVKIREDQHYAGRKRSQAAEQDVEALKHKQRIQRLEQAKQAEKRNSLFFGLTLVSCEKGDLRQSPRGVYVYDGEKKYEVLLPKSQTGRDLMLSEMYEAVVNGQKPVHDGRWGRANLQVCLAALVSSKERREIFL